MTPSPSSSLMLVTSDGVQLDAMLHRPTGDDAAAKGAFLMCHPHPLYGGDQHHPLVVSVCNAIAASGWIALRFDFRGTNRSGGQHGKGIDERRDVVAALETLASLVPGRPLVAAGYSFGSAVAMQTPYAPVSARIAVALPAAMVASGVVVDETVLLVHPRHDQYTTVESLTERVSEWPHATVNIVEGCDHFLQGFQSKICAQIASWCDQLVARG